MFCKNCGAAIKEETKFCPKCGTAIVKKEAAQTGNTAVEVDNAAVVTENIAVEVDTINETKKKKRSKKGLVILLSSVLVVIVAAVASFIIFNGFINNSNPNSNTTEKPAVIKNSYGEYYVGGDITFMLNSDSSVTPVNSILSSGEDEEDHTYIDFERSVYDGKSFFIQDRGMLNELYKYTFTDKDTLEKVVWIDEQTLKSSVVVAGKNSSSVNTRYTGNMQYWQLDGEYIYFVYIPAVEYFPEEQDIAYRLGRMAKDGSSIEFIGNEIASTYAVKDGWIYYYDNGYTYNEDSLRYSMDFDRAGIYKMKCDGSQKQLLLNNFETAENDTRSSRDLAYCNKMNIVGDYIYFIDCSKNGNCRVSRMKTDGSGLEYVSEKGAYSYTVDLENNKLYYSTGQFGYLQLEARTIYEVSMAEKTEVELFKCGSIGRPEFVYYDEYLYFTNNSYFRGLGSKDKPGVCGMRYALNSNTMETLYGYKEDIVVSYKELPLGGSAPVTETTYSYYWDEAEYYYDHY